MSANVFDLQGSISLDISEFEKNIKECRTFASNFAANLSSNMHSVDSAEKQFRAFSQEVQNVRKALNVTGDATETTAESTDGLTDEVKKAAKAFGDAAESTEELGKETKKTAKDTDNYTDSAEEAKSETGKLEKAAKSLGSTAKGVADDIGGLAGKIKDGLTAAAKVATATVTAASAAVGALAKQSVDAYGQYEQLKGGAQKIFDELDYNIIAKDAANAFKDLNMSASEYLESINLAGATFAQTMGDVKGYETARKGMLVIADYASGTGKNLAELNQKYQLITRSAASYQSIADQFAGVLPQTSADFLEQAQSAGLLSAEYKNLTQVPVAEYQQAVTAMIDKGVEALGLSQNTMRESTETLTGSMAMTKKAWDNLITGLSDPDADLGLLISNFTESAAASFRNTLPVFKQAISGVGVLISEISPVIANELPNIIQDVLPSLVSAGVSLTSAIGSAITKSAPVLAPMVKKLIVSVADIIRNNSSTALSSLASVIQEAVSYFTANAPEFIQLGMDVLTSISEGITQNLPMLITSITSLITFIAEKLTDNLPVILDSAMSIVGALGQGIVDNLPKLVTSAVKLIEKFAAYISENLPKLIPAATKMILEIAETLTAPDSIEKIVSAAVDIVIGLVTGIIDALPIIIEKAPVIIENLVTGLTSEESMNKLSTGIVEVVGKIAEFITDPENLAKIIISGTKIIFALVKGMWAIQSTVYSTITDILKECGETVKGYYEKAVEWGEKLIEWIVEGIKSVKDKVTEAIDDAIPDSIQKVVDVVADVGAGGVNPVYGTYKRIKGIAGLFGHAEGGIITRPEIAMLGENGAEAVIPLEHNTEWIDRVAERLNNKPSIVNYNTFNLEGFTIGSDYDTDRMIERISEKLESLRMSQTAAVGGVSW